MSNSDLFALVAGQPPISATISWTAEGVAIDNATIQYVYLPQLGLFVRPNAFATFPLTGAHSIQAEFAAPPGVSQPTPIIGQQAFIYLTEDKLPFYNGPTTGGQVLSASDVVLTGTIGGIPLAGTQGRLYYATDIGQFLRDSGVAWITLPIGEGSFPLGYVQLTNNQNAVVARDFLGNLVNLLLLDADPPAGNLLVGPTDPRIGIVFDSFYKRDRHHFWDDFDGSTLDPRWTQSFFGGGTFAIPGGRSQAELRSGVVGAGDGVALVLAGWGWQRANGERGCWILTVEDALNQLITLGYRSTAGPATDFVRFRVTEAGGVGTWQAECAIGGVTTTVSTGVVRDGTRRFYIIDTLHATAGFVDFYIDMVLVASINTNIPVAGDIQPFLSHLSNGAVVNRRSLIDLIELANNR